MGTAEPMRSPGLHFHLLGPVQAVVDGVPLTLGGPGMRGLLAILLLDANRVVPVDTIVDVLWDHEPPVTARTIVQGYISRLRQRLAEAAPSGEVRIATSPPGYLIAVDPERIDVTIARDLLARARTGPAARRAQLLAEAQGLWHGPALAGIGGRVRAPELDELRLAVIEGRIDADLDLGRHDEVIGELAALVDVNPFREHLVGQLMLALYRCGRRAAALEIYQRFAERARDELGIDPGPALRELHGNVLRDEVDALAPDPNPVVPPRIGVLRPAQLPAAPQGFAAREGELAWLDHLISTVDTAGTPVGVLAGPAGIGKTALAVRWAHGVAPRFADGQLYAGLRGFDQQHQPIPPGDVLAQFLLALGVAATDVPAGLDDKAALYRSLLAERRILVLLDDARDSEQIRPLLPGNAASLVLVTSRLRLDGLIIGSGARQLVLDTLPAAAAEELIAQTAGPPAGLHERMQRRRIAELCGYLPLALRIIGARLAASPRATGDLLTELSDEHTRLAALRIEGGDTSVRAALDITHRALPPEMAATLRMLGVFPGQLVGPYAVAALCDTDLDDARRQLRSLASAFMIAEVRLDVFGMHDLVRLYSRELAATELTGAERDEAVRRLIGYYLVGADQARRQLRPVVDGIAAAQQPVARPPTGTRELALEWFEDEWANLLAVAQAGAGAGAHDQVWRLARAASDFRRVRTRFDDWYWLLQLGLDSARAIGDAEGEAWILLSRCVLFARFDRSRETVADAERAVAIATQLRHRTLMAMGFNTVASALYGRRQYEQALAGWRKAFELASMGDDDLMRASLLNNIAQAQRSIGRPEEAVAPQVAALGLYRKVGEFSFSVIAMGNLAELYEEIGQLDDAERHAGEAIELASGAGMVLQEAFARQVLGRVHRDRGRLDSARALLERAFELYTEIGSPFARSARSEIDALAADV